MRACQLFGVIDDVGESGASRVGWQDASFGARNLRTVVGQFTMFIIYLAVYYQVLVPVIQFAKTIARHFLAGSTEFFDERDARGN